MGWFLSDVDGHEGFLVAYVPDQEREWIELNYFSPDAHSQNLRAFGVGCSCGWRSRRFVAPFGTSYHPHIVEMADATAEMGARELWKAHAEAKLPRRLQQLARRAR